MTKKTDITTTDHDVDIAEETAVDKGRALENEFAKFMREELNWQKVRVGAHLSGGFNRKGAAIDVLAEKLDDRGVRLKKLGTIYLIFCGVLFLYGILYGINVDWNDGIGEICIYIALPLEVGGLFALILSNKYNKENALVECKNLKSKAHKDHILKSINELDDYKRSGDKEYKFKAHYFVSANGYVENALKIATDNGLICYQKNNGKFERVTYFN
jgi:hypothetical protein